MDNLKGVVEELKNGDFNQEGQEPCQRENNDWLVIDVEEDLKNWVASQDQKLGPREDNDGPVNVEEVVDANLYQESGTRENDDGTMDVKTGDFYKELFRLKETLDSRQFPEVIKLIERELLTSRSSKSSEEKRSDVHATVNVDLFNDSWIRLTVKCFLPGNYLGKCNFSRRAFLGPKRAYFKALMTETGTEMLFRGKGSMNDPAEEQLLRDGGNPVHSDLNEEAHVLITVSAPAAAEFYSKLGYATTCLKLHVLWRGREDLTMPPWIAKVIKKGEGPSRYNKFHSSKNGYPRYTRGRDTTLPLRDVFNIENEAPVPVRSHYISTGVNLTEHNTMQAVGSAGSNRGLLPTASQEYQEAYNSENDAPVRSHYNSSGVNLTEQWSALVIPLNTVMLMQVVSSAGNDYQSPLSKTSQGRSSATTFRYHPYQ